MAPKTPLFLLAAMDLLRNGNGSWSLQIFGCRLKIKPSLRGAPLGKSCRLPSLFTRTHHLHPITMTKCRCYYRAVTRPIPPKVAPAALPGPISIEWCEGIFVYGPRPLFYGVGYNYLTVIMWKTQQCTGPLNNNWPLCPKHLNMTTDIGVTNDITIINRLTVDIFA